MEVTVGKYRTRGGQYASVFKIDQESPATFKAKGHIWGRLQSNGRRADIYTTWKVTGQHQAVGEHHWDLVERVEPDLERAAGGPVIPHPIPEEIKPEIE